ncbi:hypothetical protein DEO23_15485 [Brachybacterium endophyticum]|uniref:WXG100 family type VII secretion target n=1 Tax=Brachybacterium endophyticum TaxID=2182385 RepID=A0A2U2RGP9_9MICO|nr:WXG100 family type VII secretion target [Brachybacterium endophyticum]PWH05030.1 hypothetical protein DEO23_15485 [Brachybacterium endophyticum]
MSFKGMDPDQGRDTAQAVKDAGDKIRDAFKDLDGTVQGVEWEGPDADKFKEDWSSFTSQSLDSLVEAFQTHGKDLENQADQQDDTSNSNA